MMNDFEPISKDELDTMQTREEAALKDCMHLHSLASGDIGPYRDQPNRAFVQWVYDYSEDACIDLLRLRIAYEAAVEHINRLRTAGGTILQMAERIDALEAEIETLKPIALDRADWKEVALINQAEVERLREQMTDSWEHTWKCRHKEERERLGLPLDGCICGLPGALRGKEGDEK